MEEEVQNQEEVLEVQDQVVCKEPVVNLSESDDDEAESVNDCTCTCSSGKVFQQTEFSTKSILSQFVRNDRTFLASWYGKIPW